jgi:MFS family permease
MSRIRLLLGIGIFWLSLGMLYQGIGELVLPSYLLHVPGFGATTLGLITFVGLLAGISVQPLAGALSDQLRARWGRMPIIVAGVGLVLIATLSLASVQTWEGIFFSYVLVHVAAGIAQAGQQALLPDRLPARQRGTGAGIQAFMAFGGLMLGIALLGHVASRGGVNRALLVVGATLVGTLGLSMALLREGSQWAPNRGWIDLWKAIRVAVRLGGQDAYRLDITRHKEFTRLVAARFLFLLGVFAVQRSLLPFVANRLALDPAQATTQSNTLLAALALIAAIFSPVAGWAADRLGRVPLMIAGAVIAACGTILLTLTRHSWQMLACGGLLACGLAAFICANWALTADIVPKGQAARFMALANWGTAGAVACAGLFGLLIDGGNQIAPGGGYIACLAASALTLLSSVLPLRRVKPLPEPTSPLR